jgi:hypothetical protein
VKGFSFVTFVPFVLEIFWFIGNRRDDVANVGQIGNLSYGLPPNMVVYPGKSQRANILAF